MTVRRYPVAILLVFVTAALVVVNGFAFWGEVPTLPLLAGSAVVVGSGLALLWHERR